VREVALPARARSHSGLARIDYADTFLVPTPGHPDWSAEQWARATLEGAPPEFRLTAPAVWFALGLKHGPPWSRSCVLGWPVRHSDPDLLLLHAGSRTGMPAELLFVRGEHGLLFATLITHENRLARVVWSAIEAHHRRVVGRLLARTSRPVSR
jgi:hypothetical protein